MHNHLNPETHDDVLCEGLALCGLGAAVVLALLTLGALGYIAYLLIGMFA